MRSEKEIKQTLKDARAEKKTTKFVIVARQIQHYIETLEWVLEG